MGDLLTRPPLVAKCLPVSTLAANGDVPIRIRPARGGAIREFRVRVAAKASLATERERERWSLQADEWAVGVASSGPKGGVEDDTPVGKREEVPRAGYEGELGVGELPGIPESVLGSDPVGIAVPEADRRSDLVEGRRVAARAGDDVGGHADRALTRALPHHRGQCVGHAGA